MDNKLTDNEIIKALKECRHRACADCPRFRSGNNEEYKCRLELLDLVLDLINRQKAEIERLKEENKFCHKTIAENAQRALEVAVEEIEKAKSEAIKEFAERLKSRLLLNLGERISVVTAIDVDTLVKEMTEQS